MGGEAPGRDRNNLDSFTLCCSRLLVNTRTAHRVGWSSKGSTTMVMSAVATFKLRHAVVPGVYRHVESLHTTRTGAATVGSPTAVEEDVFSSRSPSRSSSSRSPGVNVANKLCQAGTRIDMTW